MKRISLVAAVLALAAAAPAGELPANKWVSMKEPAAGVQMLGWDEIRYAPELGGVLMWGAYRSYTSENQNALWLYRFKENRWHLLHLNLFFVRSEMCSDGGHTSGRMTYDRERKILVYNGMISMSRNDWYRTWAFDPRALVGWDARPPSPTPRQKCDGASVYVPAAKRTLQHYGNAGTWLYGAAANRWAWPVPPGKGPAGTCAEAVWDPKRKRVLVFGGSAGQYSGKSFTTYNALWAYDLAAKSWKKLAPKNPPPARGWPQMALSTAADIVLMSNGTTGTRSKHGVVESHRDTWVLDLKKLKWKQIKNAATPSAGVRNHMAYDPASDVFLMVGRRKLNYGYSCGVYAFRYQGEEPAKPQSLKTEPVPTYDLKKLPAPEGRWKSLSTGPLAALEGWCFWPSLASKGDELLLAFAECPEKFHDVGWDVRVFRGAGGAWTELKGPVVPKGWSSQTPAAAFDAKGRPLVISQAYRAWKGTTLNAARFEGGAWKPLAAPIKGVIPAFPALVGNKGKPTLAHEVHVTGGDYRGTAVFAFELDGGRWKPLAGGKPMSVIEPHRVRARWAQLQRDSKGRLVLAWQEHKPDWGGKTATPERVHVRRLEGGKWTELGRAVPISNPKARAVTYAMKLHNGEPVTAICEGTDGGRAKLHVRAWKGSGWQLLGSGPLNVLGKGSGALKPALVSDGKNLYVAWPEFLPGRPPLLFVKKWDGARWTLIGGPLNAAPGKGSAHRPALAVLGGKPAVAWTEHVPCGPRMRKVCVKVLR